MQHKPRPAREIALLLAPLGLIAAIGGWGTAHYRRTVENNSGPLRTVVLGVSQQSITPLEAWQGYDSKWVIESQMNGQHPQKSGYRFDFWRTSGHLGLSESQGEQNDTLEKLTQSNGGTCTGDGGECLSSFLIKTRDLPPHVMHLKGPITARGMLRPLDPQDDEVEVVARPALADIPVMAGEDATQLVDKKAPMVISIWVEKGTVLSGLRTVKAKVRPPLWSDVSSRDWLCLNWSVQDAEGRTIPVSVPIDVKRRRFGAGGVSTFAAAMDISDVPASRGRLVYEAWLSCEDSWPTKVTAVIRE